MVRSFDLELRTQKFAKDLIIFLKFQHIDLFNKSIISQLIRSSTSVAANYMEANSAISKKEFKYKISLCLKEIQETSYWIEMLKVSNKSTELEILYKESNELILIFGKISSTLSKQNRKFEIKPLKN